VIFGSDRIMTVSSDRAGTIRDCERYRSRPVVATNVSGRCAQGRHGLRSSLQPRRRVVHALTASPLPRSHGAETKQEQRPDMALDRTSQRTVATRTIGDLGERDQLYAYCSACRHSARLDLAALRDRYGPQLALKSLRARLRCSRCGARSIETSHVWDAGPHGRS
jgi:hypothetical protein